MPTVLSTSDLTEEIKKLENDLRTAEQARISDADRHAQQIRDQLRQKKQELRYQQELESVSIAEKQRQQQLAQLDETEKAIDERKAESIALRRMIAELPSRLAFSEFELNRLLRQYAQLKQELQS
jgi:hypothetical protein